MAHFVGEKCYCVAFQLNRGSQRRENTTYKLSFQNPKKKGCMRHQGSPASDARTELECKAECKGHGSMKLSFDIALRNN
jgi:hypothetical protein